MSKTRINKFIFQDGNVFLRLKTKARDLVFKKDGENYAIEFSSQSAGAEKIKFQVLFMQDLAEIPDENVASKSYSWGKIIKEGTCYYAIPTNTGYAAKIGPFPSDLINLDLEIDWPNIQWGTVAQA